jgi:hypothetical protein
MNKTDPTWNSKILGVKFAKNFKILKIAGSRAEFLDIFLFRDKIQNSAKIMNALWNLYVVTKIIFLKIGKNL